MPTSCLVKIHRFEPDLFPWFDNLEDLIKHYPDLGLCSKNASRSSADARAQRAQQRTAAGLPPVTNRGGKVIKQGDTK